jgi:hypothetical protein
MKRFFGSGSVRMMIMNSFYHNRKESDPANRQQTKPSSDFQAQNAIDQAWSEEVERRCIDVDRGKAKLIPGEEVFEKIKKRFSK